MQWVLETDRLLLRRFIEADAEAWLYMESDPEVLRYFGRGPRGDLEAYRQHIQLRVLPYYDRQEGLGGWVILEKDSRDFLGACSLRPALDSQIAAEMGFGKDEIDLGYALRKQSWGKGYATELARALVRKAFTDCAAPCVVASVTIANQASIRVLEKAGLRRVGEPVYLPGIDEPKVKYAMTREQFQDRS
jgi:RimJ/RimL family protein N-acetyltransferase